MLDRKEAANGRTWTPAAWLDEVVRTLPESGTGDPAESPPPAPPQTVDAPPRPHPPTARGRVVAVVGAAAGVGKTVVALHLAAALVAETAKRVALVDLDVRMGTVATVLGLRSERDVCTALDGLAREDDGQLLTHLAWAAGGFQVLTAPTVHPPAPLEGERVAELLTRLLRHYDFVVVDTPPTAEPASAAVLELAATVLLVTTPEPRSLHAGAAYLAQLGERGFPLEKLKPVLNRARPDGRGLEVELPIVARLADDAAGARGGWRDGDGALSRSARGLVRTLWPAVTATAPPVPPPASAPADTRPAGPAVRPSMPRPILIGGAAVGLVALSLAAFLLVPRGAPTTGPSAAPTATTAARIATASPAAARTEATATIAAATATRPPAATAAPTERPAPTAAPTQPANNPTIAVQPAPAAPAVTGETAPGVAPQPTAPAVVRPPAAPQLSPTAPPRILFDERFVDNARGWPNDRRSTGWLEAGWYQVAARAPGRFVALTPANVGVQRDSAVTATFKKSGGPAGGGYGVVLRAQAPLDGVSQTGRYYVLEVGDRGEVGAWRRDGDRWVDLLPWTRSPAVRTGLEANRLTALALGSRLTLIVNDQIVANLEDYELKEGRVGVFVGGDGNEVALEALRIQAAD